MKPSFPETRDIVLIGGGHSHALFLRRWGMNPLAGARLTLINPGPTAPYTGMLPGFVAGHYDRVTLDIDLVRLARFAGARLILGRATAIDRALQEIAVDDSLLGARRIGYDAASLDIGIHSDMPTIPGFAEHAVAAKPLERFAEAWSRFRQSGNPEAGMVVIGGGVGGCELAMAMSHGMGGAPVTLIEAGEILSGLGHPARDRLRQELHRNKVEVIENAEVAKIRDGAVELRDGRTIRARFVTGAAGARPHDWLSGTGLDLVEGFVAVGPGLQSSDPAIFATGDCAHLRNAPRPKAGVFAVRQAPVLHHNLRALVSGGTMKSYRPQRDYLKLISTGRKSAVADKFGLALHGKTLWQWKDRIDRAFMAKLDDLPRMPQPTLPRHHASGLARQTRQVPCGGCGAKVGRATLGSALSGLPTLHRDDVETGHGDDAAILKIGAARLVVTVDHLRAFTEDPAVMARIAALHALGDCLAMGAAPQAFLPALTLPRLSPDLEARTLSEIMAALAAVAEDVGGEIVGGHTSTGPELQIGLTVTGLLDRAPKLLSGAQAGDRIVVTKPLGTGVVLAGEMALDARGSEVAVALRHMSDRNPIDLDGAHAATDVTGFGLAGHLMGICEASHLSAQIELGAIPLLQGAARLLTMGTRSTLHDSNRAVADRMDLPVTPLADILFDPQTAGGYLLAIPQNVPLPEGATEIGRFEAGDPFIRVR